MVLARHIFGGLEAAPPRRLWLKGRAHIWKAGTTLGNADPGGTSPGSCVTPSVCDIVAETDYAKFTGSLRPPGNE